MAEHISDWVMTLEADRGNEEMKGEVGFQSNPIALPSTGAGMEVVFAIVKRQCDHQVVLNSMGKNGLPGHDRNRTGTTKGLPAPSCTMDADAILSHATSHTTCITVCQGNTLYSDHCGIVCIRIRVL